MHQIQVTVGSKKTGKLLEAIIADVIVIVKTVNPAKDSLPVIDEKASAALETAVGTVAEHLLKGSMEKHMQNQRRRKPKAIKKKK